MRFAGVVSMMLLAGCVGPHNAPPLSVADPAHVDAAETPYTRPVSVLAGDRSGVPGTQPKEQSEPEGASHQHGASPNPGNALSPPEGKAAGASTRSLNNQAEKGDVNTCPMHPEVIRSAPGRCPKCNMPLIKKPGGVNHDQHGERVHE
jgi:hypothetical protein